MNEVTWCLIPVTLTLSDSVVTGQEVMVLKMVLNHCLNRIVQPGEETAPGRPLVAFQCLKGATGELRRDPLSGSEVIG